VAIDFRATIAPPQFDLANFALTYTPGEGVNEIIALLAGRFGLTFESIQVWTWVIAATEVPISARENAEPHHRYMDSVAPALGLPERAGLRYEKADHASARSVGDSVDPDTPTSR
jgi:hypothetical protein